MARQVMEQIVQSGRVQRGRIGVSLQDLSATERTGRMEGAIIADVAAASPAEKAGIPKGDIVVRADDMPIRSAAQLRNKVGLTPVGRAVRLTVERDGAPRDMTVEVAAPEDVAAGKRK